MSSGNQRYINTAGTHDITMNDDFINVSTSVGAITLVFPNIRDSGAIPTNKVWFVNDVDDMAATNNVTIVASATTPATELNGGSSVVLDTNGFSAEIVPSGYYSYMVNSGISDGGMTGSGTLNYLAKFTPNGTALGNSQLFDNGTNVGLGIILPTSKLHVYLNTTSSGASIFKVSFPLADILNIDDNYNVNFTTNNGVNITGSNGSLNLISNGGTSPSISFKFNNGASTSGVIYGNGLSMGFQTPLFGIGNSVFTATSNLHLKGTNGYNQFRLETTYTPTSTADANGNTGDVSWDDSYIYVKTSGGWKRSALSTF